MSRLVFSAYAICVAGACLCAALTEVTIARSPAIVVAGLWGLVAFACLREVARLWEDV